MLRRHWSVQFRAMVRMAQSCRQEQHKLGAAVASIQMTWDGCTQALCNELLHRECRYELLGGGSQQPQLLHAAHSHLEHAVLLAASGPATAHSAPILVCMSQPTSLTLNAMKSVCCPAHGPQCNMMAIKVMAVE